MESCKAQIMIREYYQCFFHLKLPRFDVKHKRYTKKKIKIL